MTIYYRGYAAVTGLAKMAMRIGFIFNYQTARYATLLICIAWLSPALNAEDEGLWRKHRFEDAEKILVTVINAGQTGQRSDSQARKAAVQESQRAIKNGFGVSDSDVLHEYSNIPALTFWMPESVFRGLDSDERGNRRSSDQPLENFILSPEIGGGGDQSASLESGSGALVDSRMIVGANDMHDLGFTGAGARLAVVDTGIDRDNPDFTGRIIAEACFCYNPSANCCPDGTDEQSGSGSAEDDQGHGTHVAGICAADGSNKGMAPGAEIVAVKTLDSSNSFYSFSDQTAALDWLYGQNLNLAAVSMSLATFASYAGECDQTASWMLAAYQAVENLRSLGTEVVVAAGNSATVNVLPVPACLSNTITVGATDDADVAASFSNSSPYVDFFAPGVSIISSEVDGTTTTKSGTSMAAPHVAGGLALLSHALDQEVAITEIIAAMASVSPIVTDSSGNAAPRIELYLTYQESLPPEVGLPAWLLYEASK